MPSWEETLSPSEVRFVRACISRAELGDVEWGSLVESARKMQRHRRIEVLGVRNYEVRGDVPLPHVQPVMSREWSLGPDNLSWSSGYFNDKSDENIYTVRFSDLYQFCIQEDWDMGCMRQLANMPESIVINALVWSIATSGDLSNAELLARSGWFNDLDTFIDLAKRTNVLAKGYRLKGVDNSHFMELSAFTGYRTRALEKDRAALNEQVYEMFDNADPYVDGYEDVFRARYKMGRYPPLHYSVGFKEYLDRAEWVSDGSASFSGSARPELLLEGESVKLRLTKARLADIMELSDLVALVRSRAGVVINEPLEKAETQKIRWIFSTDIVSYLIHDYLCAHIDKSVVLEGLSLGEGLRALMTRLATTLADCSLGARNGLIDALNEPFFRILATLGVSMSSQAISSSVQWMGDIDKMDNTVRNWQIDLWTRNVLSHRHVPYWLEDVALRMPWQTLVLRPDLSPEVQAAEKKRAVNVFLQHGAQAIDQLLATGNWIRAKSGLASGLRITSYVGSDVNLSNLELAAGLVNKLLGRLAVTRLQVRGDDSIALCDTPETAVLLHVVMAGCTNLSTSKSRASRNAEFLRLQYVPPEVDNNWGVRGILARSVVAWTQRKPIASEQVSTFASKVVGLYVNYGTLSRRGCHQKLATLRDYIATAVLAKDGLNIEWLHASVENGGGGIAPLNRNRYSKRVLPRGSVMNLSNWSVERTRAKFQAYSVTIEEARELASAGLINSLAMSDEPSVKNFIRSQPVPRLLTRQPGLALDLIARAPEIDVCYDLGSRSSFGSRRDVADRFKLAAEVARLRRVTAASLLSLEDDLLIRRVKKTTGLSRPRAVDWLGGTISAGHTDCHPELTAIALRIAVGMFRSCNLRGDDKLALCHYVASTRLMVASRLLASW